MAQVLKNKCRDSNNQCKPTLIWFRDILGLIKSMDRLSPEPLQETDLESSTDDSEVLDDEITQVIDDKPEDMGNLDKPEEWEIGAGLDKNPEPVLGVNASKSCKYFEVAQNNGIDLSNPSLRDLLCDTPNEDDFTQGSTVSPSESGPLLPYADIYASPTMF
ncbi:hypothetical protein RSOLAG22IIIB_07408 [Rhizoctonia solani]|uniref:Uncharacterized protein n=1 Tax=Rhizoctonia solani TaxID=456999 RepID=A0A0K6FMY1_9AGAM|nr:hypothetical protein RSOLAG22IIIB_07408 [Rhizoctonia solani]